MDDIALLRKVLAASAASIIVSDIESSRLLERLLKLAPAIIRQQRKPTLFEALHVLDREGPHSDFLSWLLDPLGPLTENWFLNAIVKRVAPNQTLDGDPIVEREVAIESGRLDILISWESFKIVIENKVWSAEGEGQVAKYLRWAEKCCTCDFNIIYLSLEGKFPASVAEGHHRLTSMSYSDIIKILNDGINGGLEDNNDRGKVFASEFRNSMLRLLKMRYDEMIEPHVSESTKVYIGNAAQLLKLKVLAIEEFADFLDWTYAQIEMKLRPIVGQDMVVHRGRYVVIFRRPSWQHGKMIFGFYFGVNQDPKKILISEANEGPWVGVGPWRADDTFDIKGCQMVVDNLSPLVEKVWPNKVEVNDPDYSMALCREIRLPLDGNIDKWAENVVSFFGELASVLTPTLQLAADPSV